MQTKRARNESGSTLVQVIFLFGLLSVFMYISMGELIRNSENARGIRSQYLRRQFESQFTQFLLRDASCPANLAGLTLNPTKKTLHKVGGLIGVFQGFLKNTTWEKKYSVDDVELEILPDPVAKRSYYSTLKVSMKAKESSDLPIKKLELKFFLLTNSTVVANKTIVACQTDEQQACEQLGGTVKFNPKLYCDRPAKI